MLLWFNEINSTDIGQVGGKGSNLGEMSKAGFPVPPGFCVGTNAYNKHIEASNLWEQIEVLLNGISTMDITELDIVAEKIRRLIEEAPMPREINLEIKEFYAKLCNDGYKRVAVRSSATAEDLPEASFAGQQDTYLSVQGEDEVLRYVKKCWASLWTGRSIMYRNHNGFKHEEVYLAVVVQGMVEAEKAGVLFTVNAITGKRDEMLVNASYGLGESVVSGKVTPDVYRISKNLDKKLIIEQQLGEKQTKIISSENGLTIEKEVSETERAIFCLNESELFNLAKLGNLVEKHYNVPQDIEWAFCGKNLYLLQTRPVTVIKNSEDLEIENRKISKEEEIILEGWKEHIPDAPYPLEYTTIIRLSDVKNSIYHELGICMPQEEKAVRMDNRGIISFKKLSPHPNAKILLLPINISRLLKLSPTNSSVNDEEKLSAIVKEMRLIKVEFLQDSELAEYIEKAISTALEYGKIRFKVYVFPMVIRGVILKKLLGIAGVSKEVNQFDLLAGLDHKTSLIEKSLYELAKYALTLPRVSKILTSQLSEDVFNELEGFKEGRDFLSKMNLFVNENGARTMKTLLPFSNLSWSEDKISLLRTIAAILRSDNVHEQISKISDSEKKYILRKNDILKRLPFFLRNLFVKTVEKFRNDCKGREGLLYGIEECYVIARCGVFEAAKRLKKSNYIKHEDDIKYLYLNELYLALSGKQKENISENVAARKLNRVNAEMVWVGTIEEGIDDKSNLLTGLSGSPGKIRGRVRIIKGDSEFSKLQKGEILVCAFTDPAWTPLFSLAAAVVADTGGPLSHAAIVAREYSIPAVLGTRIATTRLKDGDNVVVDGFNGTVSII